VLRVVQFSQKGELFGWSGELFGAWSRQVRRAIHLKEDQLASSNKPLAVSGYPRIRFEKAISLHLTDVWQRGHHVGLQGVVLWPQPKPYPPTLYNQENLQSWTAA
jgi:hypothetical protein